MSLEFRRFEHAGWERAAKAYADAFTTVTAKVGEAALDVCLSQTTPKPILLDVATGPGTVAEIASARGARPVGVDFSREMLALAQQTLEGPKRARLVRGDADALPFGRDTFDAVVCNFGLLHFAHPDRATTEMARVARRGAVVAVSVWSPPERNLLFGSIYRALEKHAPKRPDVPAGPPFFQFADDSRMKTLLESAGLTEARVNLVAFAAAFESPRAVIELFMEGSVRTAAILRAQDEAARARILESVAAELAPHERGGAFHIPVEAVVASARKP